MQRCEHFGRALHRFIERACARSDDPRRALAPGQELRRALRELNQGQGYGGMHPGACVAAVMHRVIDEQRMAPQ
jgi:hypothetical protein